MITVKEMPHPYNENKKIKYIDANEMTHLQFEYYYNLMVKSYREKKPIEIETLAKLVNDYKPSLLRRILFELTGL